VLISRWAGPALAITALALTGCALNEPPKKLAAPIRINEDPYPSTYQRYPGALTVIRHATVIDGDGHQIGDGTIVFGDGVIKAVGGPELSSPAGAAEVDGTGKFVTPGIIDVHSHLGDYPSPGVASLSDGNEATSPVRPEVWAEHSVWPQDPGFSRALINGGVTTLQVLPGSANLFGGRSVVLKNVPGRTAQDMKFPGAPYGLKMACGENPKRVYGSKGNMPQTRMGNIALARATWIKAQAYKRKWDKYYAKGGDMPERDLAMDTLMGVLDGKILVQNHCYRADEMAQMLDLAKEFGFKIRSFHHAIEAYKIADLLAANGTAASVWSDWGGFKMEAFDEILENAALLTQAGARAVIHTDSPDGIQRMNQDMAKAYYAGVRAGITLTRDQAIRWITANPAWVLGIEQLTGTLEPGKLADVTLWSGDPFSVYSKAEKVWNEGWLAFDRLDPKHQYATDFNLGQTLPGVGR
jgi:imidazolonepropionase-like amidohydrolase